MRAIIDSDILIDYLQGNTKAKEELEEYTNREISIISWMEVMAGADSKDEELECAEFLDSFKIHQISIDIAAEAVRLRRKYRLRLPDAIIWATARMNGCLLVTRNTKDFSINAPGIRIPY